MMMTKLEKNHAQALAAFITTLRPDWDPQGVYVALGKARDHGDAAQVAIAAIRAATTPTNRTPAVIPLQGDHWAVSSTPGTPAPHRGTRAPRCTVYGHENYPAHNCAGCRTDALTAGVAAANPAPPPPMPHGRDLAAGKDT
ncbi:hypothetical protein [Georgenia faecalis]|uniref:hypothetical protein n=1 Tax=Georgenia faecalis TaxID=2483799 RepID=UPI0019D08032|nr:hypothetical protein [Georgenia faecalis]